MIAFLYYPLYLIVFWYKDVLGGVFTFFVEFNRYVASLLSLPLLFKTYFKPLKNEYRQGLVLFSIVAGIVVKTPLILIGSTVILVLLAIEVIAEFVLLLLPLALLMLFVFGKTLTS